MLLIIDVWGQLSFRAITAQTEALPQQERPYLNRKGTWTTKIAYQSVIFNIFSRVFVLFKQIIDSETIVIGCTMTMKTL